MTKPKCRPLLLKPWEVPPLLSGRKTLIARPVKPQPRSVGDHFSTNQHGTPMVQRKHYGKWEPVPCPFGAPGYRLWGQETWRLTDDLQAWDIPEAVASYIPGAYYRADVDGDSSGCGWRPGTQMPRWASRITLAVDDIECKRLDEVTEDEAQSLGIKRPVLFEGPQFTHPVTGMQMAGHPGTGYYVDGFREQWDTDYGKDYPFSSNPYVWLGTVGVIEGESS